MHTLNYYWQQSEDQIKEKTKAIKARQLELDAQRLILDLESKAEKKSQDLETYIRLLLKASNPDFSQVVKMQKELNELTDEISITHSIARALFSKVEVGEAGEHPMNKKCEQDEPCDEIGKTS